MKTVLFFSLALVALLVNLRYQGIVTEIASVDNAVAQLMAVIGLH